MKNILYIILIIMTIGCNGNSSNDSAQEGQQAGTTPQINYTVAAEYPHSIDAFTEGLVFHNGELYESTGSPEEMPETESMVGIVNLADGSLQQKVVLDKSIYFGEGIVFVKDRLFQLTYKNNTCFVYDARTFIKLGQYTFVNKEGWGLTTDGSLIIMSDGTNMLSFVNPDNFQIVRQLSVSENGYALQQLNELEYIEGFVYANVWLTNDIVKIDPISGKVLGRINLSDLKDRVLKIYPKAQETNGIAYNPATKKVLVTGKMWPKIYEIEFAK